MSSGAEPEGRNVVIIGAPRSGTNMLRDLICNAPGVATWPCDEINYIWRYGNARHSSDAFTPDMATPGVREYIRCQFRWVARRYGVTTVVEKTCANSLRVGFVEQVLDAPKYVFIHRDGLDATQSAMVRWRAPFDLAYVLRKARFVPLSTMPYYAGRYLGIRMSRLLSGDKSVSTWGPRWPGMVEQSRTLSLAELCAMQWKECVDRSLDAFEGISEARVLRVSYEALVTAPSDEVSRLAEFLDIDAKSLLASPFFRKIRSDSIGKARSIVDTETLSAIRPIVEPTMQRLAAA